MNCLTDIGGKKGIGKKFIKDLNMGKTHLSGGLFLSATYKYALGLRPVSYTHLTLPTRALV